MKAFWGFAQRMLRYRRLLAIGLAAALLDAACAFGGFAALMWVIDQLLGAELTVRQMLAQKLAQPEVVRWIGDRSDLAQWVPEGRFEGFTFVLAVILILAAIGSAMRFTHQSCMISVALRTVMRIRKEAFHRLVHVPAELIWTQGTADHLSRIVRDCTQLSRGLNALMGKALRDVFMGGALLVLALLINPVLTAIFLLGLPAVLVCIRKFGKQIRRASKSAFRAYGWMTGAVQESIRAIEVVKAHNAEGYERRRFNTINRQVLRQELQARTARALSSPVIELIAIAGVIVVSVIAAWFAFHTPGGNPKDLVKVLVTLAAAGASFRPLANLNNDLQEAAAAAERIQAVLTLPVEPNTRGSFRQRVPALRRHSQEVRFEHVSYAYPGSQTLAIRDIQLAVPHGTAVALVGPNGSGKSTLLSLLPRLISPTRGRVLIDGVDISQVSLRSLRGQIALVTQHTVLFEGTIADNIAYGQRHATMEQIEAAARAAYAHEFIAALPDGYRTRLGEGGTGLSGGQKQRLAIARAILRDPAILILDEATSQVDAESEARINAALADLRQGRTTFIIAHRLSTVIDADLIVVMADGRIVDQGTHAQLLDRCPAYQVLTRTQLQPARA